MDGFLESQRVAPGSLHHLYAAHDMDEDDHRDEASLPPLGAVSVSVPEAGRMLGLSRAEAYRRARSGELAPGVPAIVFGSRLIRVSRFQLDRYLTDRSRGG